jgi:lactate dehydrogenase-like 2-hydroxyacid dehydrogenase
MRKPDLLLACPFSLLDTEAMQRDFVLHEPWAAPDPEAYLTRIAPEIRAIATTGTKGASAELMARLPKLEIVACFGVGFDLIDLDHARSRGIRVTNTPGVLTNDVADMGLALMLAVARRIPLGDKWVRDQSWTSGPMPLTTSLSGKRLGVLGLGRIGHAIAKRAEAFGMDILYTGRHQQPEVAYGWRADPTALAADCDFLMISAAGGADTTGLVDRKVLQALGPAGFIINIARGSLIDQPDLIAALEAGEIAGAGLDVFVDEPLGASPLLAMPNVVLQPHNGSGTRETRAAIGQLQRDNLLAHFAGQPLPTPVI